MANQWCDNSTDQWQVDNLEQWVEDGWSVYTQGISRYFLYSIDQNYFFETEPFTNFFITNDSNYYFITEEI